MRRTSAVLLSATVVALGLPAAGQATAEADASACAVSTLPNPADGTATVTAMTGNTTFYGSVSPVGNGSGVVWRDGAIVDALAFNPVDANASGVLIGYRYTPDTRWSQPVGQRPGEEPVDIGSTQDAVHEINDAGTYVGSGTVGHWPYYFSIAFVGSADTWTGYALESSLDVPIAALAVDDNGDVLGRSDYDRDGVRTAAVWRDGASGAPQDLGPADELDPEDIDAGTVLVNRALHDDIALIDLASGDVTAVPGSTGYRGISLKNGTILANSADGYALFRDGTSTDLAPPAGSTITSAGALSSDGTTVGGQTRTSAGALVPTVWRCG
ncbi:hypothetical protein [Actinophytocola gossypii]|uniref:Uncharacterized protein n=1 Tax=Actinophytocola gossypii TaxID=2812003 RepID=A0ABT2J7R1_9PSEU|nr:hypothetical protein [Actinophytocola gossypii]MCT2583890.1 hypothetical protein [Actinophytocola gossypii]